MKIVKKPKDLLAGLLFLLLGIGVIAIASSYQFGSLRRMGPGFFPVVLGGLLCLLSALIMLRAMLGEVEEMEPVTVGVLRAALMVLAATLLYALLLQPFGMVVATIVMVLVGSLAIPRYGALAGLVTGVVLAAGSALVFVRLLGQQIPLFGTVFG